MLKKILGIILVIFGLGILIGVNFIESPTHMYIKAIVVSIVIFGMGMGMVIPKKKPHFIDSSKN